MVKVYLKSIRGEQHVFDELDENLTVAEFRGIADKMLEHTFVPKKIVKKWLNRTKHHKHTNNDIEK